MQLGPLITASSQPVSCRAADVPRHLALLGNTSGSPQGASTRSDGFPPLGYAAARCWPKRSKHEAWTTPFSPLHARHAFCTVVGDITFARMASGEIALVFTQFQHLTGNSLDQFKDTTTSRGVAQGVQVRRHDLPLRAGEKSMTEWNHGAAAR